MSIDFFLFIHTFLDTYTCFKCLEFWTLEVQTMLNICIVLFQYLNGKFTTHRPSVIVIFRQLFTIRFKNGIVASVRIHSVVFVDFASWLCFCILHSLYIFQKLCFQQKKRNTLLHQNINESLFYPIFGIKGFQKCLLAYSKI